MSDINTIAVRRALLLVFAGIALAVIGASLAMATGRPVWRAVAVGALAQTFGWVLAVHYRRGGAA
ncbi:hypothetical protein [Streptomyces sp. McG3]|uniref:hypothetical protein n=1 Tax=Streptomyces sp. McG3 TaxID=2725483 RepID=UPI001BE77970|nr:hypothetical protein [Streptomyces sp. McG3]MBT2895641.1 hypothetical protein [Streptomyces sp. McG3]